MVKALIGAALLAALTGCGVLDNTLRPESTLQEKAARSIGTTPDSITIQNRVGGFASVHFYAKREKILYRCYYPALLVTSGDATCRNGGTGETP